MLLHSLAQCVYVILVSVKQRHPYRVRKKMGHNTWHVQERDHTGIASVVFRQLRKKPRNCCRWIFRIFYSNPALNAFSIYLTGNLPELFLIHSLQFFSEWTAVVFPFPLLNCGSSSPLQHENAKTSLIEKNSWLWRMELKSPNKLPK